MVNDDVETGTPGELDRITLLGISATGHHGVLPAERRDGQPFSADVVLHLDTRPAARADDLALTADYGTLAEQVAGVLAGPPVDLVETLAQRIADVALSVPVVEMVDVVVHKPQAPIVVPFDDVQVAIRRRRPATARPGPESAVASAPPVEPEPAAAPEPDPLAIRPPLEVRAVLALGGNVGDVRATLRDALRALAATDGVRLVAVSPLARTAAVGPEQDDYFNAVVVVRTSLSPRELLAATSAIEDAHGRVREERWGPRTLDIDIVTIDGILSTDPSLELPHPRARDRAFVLVPWAQVDPSAVLPGLGGGTVTALAETAPDRAGIRWLALDWFDPATGADDAADAPPEQAGTQAPPGTVP